MTKAQYHQFLKLPQSRKKVFISIAKRERLDKQDIYWLELGYAVHDSKVRKAMFEYVRGGK